jgi:ureidoacrylate peracid hydrolase
MPTAGSVAEEIGSCFSTPSSRTRFARAHSRSYAGKQTVWTGLTTAPADLTLLKNRYSALIPGSSQLERTLRGMGIDTILIAGTKTNVCWESTARDAMMLDFKVVMVEDCCAALADD